MFDTSTETGRENAPVRSFCHPRRHVLKYSPFIYVEKPPLGDTLRPFSAKGRICIRPLEAAAGFPYTGGTKCGGEVRRCLEGTGRTHGSRRFTGGCSTHCTPMPCGACPTLSRYDSEAVQDTFRVACEREDKLFASDNPEGWLMNVLKNVIRRHPAGAGEAGGDRPGGPGRERRGGGRGAGPGYPLRRPLGQRGLPAPEADRPDRCTILEAAEELGIPLETCKKRVQRARKRLQKRLAGGRCPVTAVFGHIPDRNSEGGVRNV